MKRTWVIPAILVGGLAGLGGLTQPASAQDYNDNGSGYTNDERDTGSMDGEGGYDRWSGQYIWDNDRGGDNGPRWRDRDDDRGGYGYRQWRRGDDDNTCGPRGRGWSRGENSGRYYGHGYGRDRGYDRDGGNDRDRGNESDRYDRRDGRGDDWREGNQFNRDDSDRGYRGHGYYHQYHHRQEGRIDGRRDDSRDDRKGDRSEGRQEQRSESRQQDRSDGRQGERSENRGGPAQGRVWDPARLDSVKKEIGITAAQEETWTKYAETMKSVADARKARRESMDRDAILRMSTEEHRKFRDSMIEQRRKEQDSVNAAVDAVIKSLDEKQVAIAKEVLPGYNFGARMRGASMGMGMGMGMGCRGAANR